MESFPYTVVGYGNPIEPGVYNFAMAIGKPRMSGKRAGKTAVYCRDRTDASRHGSADA
jgi:hypothetical protein